MNRYRLATRAKAYPKRKTSILSNGKKKLWHWFGLSKSSVYISQSMSLNWKRITDHSKRFSQLGPNHIRQSRTMGFAIAVIPIQSGRSGRRIKHSGSVFKNVPRNRRYFRWGLQPVPIRAIQESAALTLTIVSSNDWKPPKNTESEVKRYQPFHQQFSNIGGHLISGTKVVIPLSLRQ